MYRNVCIKYYLTLERLKVIEENEINIAFMFQTSNSLFSSDRGTYN